MAQKYTAVIIKDAEFWIGWIEEVPGVNCQESSREALQKSLMIMLKQTLIFNRQESCDVLDLHFKEEE